MQTMQLTPEQLAVQRKSRRTLLLILLVAVAPVLGAYIAFYFWKPAAGANYGELIRPAAQVDWQTLRGLQDAPLDATPLRGRWVLAYVGGQSCDAACEQALYLTRQVRTAQAKEVERVVRVWLLPDGASPAEALLAQHPGLILAKANAALAPEIGRVVLIDPQGNLMMRFPAQLDPKGMIGDLKRLLKYSRLG